MKPGRNEKAAAMAASRLAEEVNGVEAHRAASKAHCAADAACSKYEHASAEEEARVKADSRFHSQRAWDHELAARQLEGSARRPRRRAA